MERGRDRETEREIPGRNFRMEIKNSLQGLKGKLEKKKK